MSRIRKGAGILLLVRSLRKDYGSKTAVGGISFEIASPGIVGFLGPNGAGKTTTLRMIAGLAPPTDGKVLVMGVDIWENPAKGKDCLGFVPDVPALFPKLTGHEFLSFIGAMRNLAPRDARERIGELLLRLGLYDNQHQLIETYSLGMKRKVAVAAALLHNPSVLLLDEPMTSLDPQSIKVLKQILNERTQRGQVSFLSTHLLDVAQSVCDCVMVLHHGQIVLPPQSIDVLKTGSLEDLFLELTQGEPGG